MLFKTIKVVIQEFCVCAPNHIVLSKIYNTNNIEKSPKNKVSTPNPHKGIESIFMGDG